jgi:hypothetical protein
MIRSTLLRFIVLVVLSASAFAQDVQARTPARSRAKTLLERAREIEDIRAPDAPPFRLRAAFFFAGKDFDAVEGTYTETWLSSSRWRQETVVGDLQEIAVGGSGKHWVLFSDGFPPRADRASAILTFIPPVSLYLDFASVKKLAGRDLTAECAYTRPDKHQFRSVFCFDEETGFLLQKVFPVARPGNVVSFSCAYSSFQNFQKYLFPREVSCFEGQHKAISARVVELSASSALSPDFFDPPGGAVEIPECSGKLVRPYLVSSAFAFALNPDTTAHVPVWFMVNVKDQPENIRALTRLDKDSYQKAIDAVHALSFEHGTCNGRPMAMPVSMQVSIPRER